MEEASRHNWLALNLACRRSEAPTHATLPLEVWRRPAAQVFACRPPRQELRRRSEPPAEPPAPCAVTSPACRATDPNPFPLHRPRGCHAGCVREPLRASQRRPSFRRRCLVLAQHTTAVKQSAPPQGANRRGTPGGTPPRPPAAAAHFTLPRVVCCSAAPGAPAAREPGPNQTRPGAAQPRPPAPSKLAGVPPSKCWSGGAPCAPTLSAGSAAPVRAACGGLRAPLCCDFDHRRLDRAVPLSSQTSEGRRSVRPSAFRRFCGPRTGLAGSRKKCGTNPRPCS